MMIALVIMLLAFGCWYNDKQNKKKNPYVEAHKVKLRNDKDYSSYLKWCRQNNELPMDKQVFIKEIERKENNLKKLLKEIQ